MDDKTKYFMIDCGTLLTNRKYQKDLDSVIERAKDSGKFFENFCWNFFSLLGLKFVYSIVFNIILINFKSSKVIM